MIQRPVPQTAHPSSADDHYHLLMAPLSDTMDMYAALEGSRACFSMNDSIGVGVGVVLHFKWSGSIEFDCAF